MIYDANCNWARYFSHEHNVWEKAFVFINRCHTEMENGRYDFDDSGFYAIVSAYDTKPLTASNVEIHRQHIDIQVLLAGEEIIYHTPIDKLAVHTPFDAAKDCGFFSYQGADAVKLRLKPGRFAVFFPEEGHVPGINCGRQPKPVKKVVVKICRSLLID